MPAQSWPCHSHQTTRTFSRTQSPGPFIRQRRSEHLAGFRVPPSPIVGASRPQPGWASPKGDSRMVPGSLCSQRCEPELPRSMGGGLAASEPAGGVRAGVSDGLSRVSSPLPGSALPPATALHSLPGTDLPDHFLPSFLPWLPAQPGKEALGAGALTRPPEASEGFFPTCHGTSEPQFPHLVDVGGRHPVRESFKVSVGECRKGPGQQLHAVSIWPPQASKIILMFIFERERERERHPKGEWGRGRERGRHRIPSRLQAPSCQPQSPTRGSNSRTSRS